MPNSKLCRNFSLGGEGSGYGGDGGRGGGRGRHNKGPPGESLFGTRIYPPKFQSNQDLFSQTVIVRSAQILRY